MPFTGYRISSNYGYRTHPITGVKQSFHAGIDLVKPHKSPIGAFVAGVVIYAGWGNPGSGLGNYGYVVLIQDSKGYAHLYAHLDSVAVRAGQKVAKGQTVGYQGNTGLSAGSHLHYEIRKVCSPSYGWKEDRLNSTVDPTLYLRSLGLNAAPKTYLSTGDSSEKVKTMQQGLIKLGHDLGKYGADGKFGKDTAEAVKKFQSNHKLESDGLFGVKSEAKLNELLKPTQKKNTVHLPASAKTWRTYKTNVQPVKKNSDWSLTPSAFGGLTYEILGRPYKDVVTIMTSRGKRNIYVGPDTNAVIK